MTPIFVPLAEIRRSSGLSRQPARSALGPATQVQQIDQSNEGAPGAPLADQFGRELRDLRISVTDRCNFRCVYCMPKTVFGKDHQFLPHSALLSFEEIERVASAFVAHGVQKIRLTGGEPLLRRNLDTLVARLAQLRTPSGATPELTLTTNGSLLARKAAVLRDAGLTRVTVSLDALDDALFKRMNDVDFPVADVLAGIKAAHAAGLGPIKVNMVVKRGTNDSQILPMARFFRGTGVILRFIEYMDVGASNGWNMAEVVPSDAIVALIASEFPLLEAPPRHASDTARRWLYADGGGEIGVISSVTQAFCGTCTRARLSTDGKVYLCLFANHGYDLRALLRGDGRSAAASSAELSSAVGAIWRGRADRYSELRAGAPLVLAGASAAAPGAAPADTAPRVEMSYIGG